MDINERISNKTSDQLSQLLSDLERERNDFEAKNDLLEDELSRLAREVLKLREKGKEIEDVLRKGRQLVREKKFEEKLTTRAFWASKGR